MVVVGKREGMRVYSLEGSMGGGGMSVILITGQIIGNQQLPFSDLLKGGAIAVSEQLVFTINPSSSQFPHTHTLHSPLSYMMLYKVKLLVV